MGKRLPHTPASRIKAALGTLWLRSRERAAAIKREHNTCQDCGRKGSSAKGREVKIEVDHVEPIAWGQLAKAVREWLLVDPAKLRVLCKECHRRKTESEK